MSLSGRIRGRQLAALHTLYARRAARAGGDPGNRSERLGWASHELGRAVTSFGTLSAEEACELIDRLKRELGQESEGPSRRAGRQASQGYGTAGRRGRIEQEIRLVDADTLRLLCRLREALGWSEEQLAFFLRSRRSPVKSGAIRTLGEANRVIWALKGMLRHRNKSDEADATLRRAG